VNYVGEKKVDPITFAIYPDDRGAAAATLYEDDGVSPAYQSGAFRRTEVTVRRAGNGYVASIAAPVGPYNPGARRFTFVIKSAPASRVVTFPDEGQSRRLEIK
jgi:alpha-glucosidase (family GH31 glycosyl hydrolase)